MNGVAVRGLLAAAQLGLDSHSDSKPMDLSSAGCMGDLSGVAQLLSRNIYGLPRQGLQDHPLINASRLAELVRQQHRESEERERGEGRGDWEQRRTTGARDWNQENTEKNQENKEEYLLQEEEEEDSRPLDLIKVKVSERRESSDSSGVRRKSWSPGSPAGSTSGSESGNREVKRRRLDELLTKKFDRIGSREGSSHPSSSPSSSTSPSFHTISSDPLTNSQMERRKSPETSPKVHRRKQTRPSNPNSPQSQTKPDSPFFSLPRLFSPDSSPPSLSIRPNSDLFPPMATSSPNKMPRLSSPVRRDVTPPTTPPPIRPVSPDKLDENDNNELLKTQILQMQLSSAMNSPETLKTLQYNPLLYYTYYAQMLSNLQAQQKLLQFSSSIPPLPSPTLPSPTLPSPSQSNNNVKDFLSLASLVGARDTKDSGGYRFDTRSPMSNDSPTNFKDYDEPRKRAPRALTGRYVRTGTAASPKVLQILRKKIEERLKLKELLGDSNHPYFQSFNKNSHFKIGQKF